MKTAAPPSDVPLSEWMRENFAVTEGASLGPWRPWPPQTAIVDAIGDREHTFVTVLKAIRVGYTTSLTGAIAAIVDRAPGPVLMVQPRDTDCRGYVVDTLEPSFAAIPRLAKVLDEEVSKDRQTIRDKRFPGGTFKIRAAGSPANLRRIPAKYLLMDETDAEGYGDSKGEGDSIALALGRTTEFPDRKVVQGSTPTTEMSSRVWKSWLRSDQRKFEVPCPDCGEFSEIVWEDIVYEPSMPEEARWKCPKCGVLHEERKKGALVAGGRWVATKPDVKDHAGFHLSSLISLYANSSWAKLAAQWEGAKASGVAEQQVFVNQVLGLPWSDAMVGLDPDSLAGRKEKEWGRDHLSGKVVLPPEVLLLTAGVDTQDSWLEIVLLGWSRTQLFALDHHQVHGSTKSDSTWLELHTYLQQVFEHPLGGSLKIGGVAIDAGGHATDEVYKYSMASARYNIWAIFGRGKDEYFLPQPRAKKTGRIHALIGANKLKEDLLDRLQRDPAERRAVRFGCGLETPFFMGLTAEQKIVKRKGGTQIIEWNQIRERNEALDCFVYGMGIRHSVGCRVDFDEIEKKLRAQQRVAVEPPRSIGWRVLSQGI